MWRRVFAVALMGAPFIFGGIRLLTTGNDARFLFAALAAAAGALAFGPRYASRTSSRLRSTLSATIAGTVAASACALALGATSVPAIVAVAAAFAICLSCGISLWSRA